MRVGLLWALWAGCIGPDAGPNPAADDSPGLVGREAWVHGTLTGTPGGRAPTHVLAVDPTPDFGERLLQGLDPDGSFGFVLPVEHPYLLVVLGGTATGADAVLGTLRFGELDVFVTGPEGADVELGDVALGAVGDATDVGDLLRPLLAPEAYDAIARGGAFARRYTQPDVDGDGELDVPQGQRFALDLHLTGQVDAAAGVPARAADLLDGYAPAPAVSIGPATLLATWSASFDGTEYVDPASGALAGGSFLATVSDGAPVEAPSSYQAFSEGGVVGWGPSWQAGQALPGASGAPASLDWGLSGIGAHLVFTDVTPRSRAAYEDDGLLVPRVRLDTADGVLTGVSWQWQRVSGGVWEDVSDAELAARVSPETAFARVDFKQLYSRHLRVPIGGAASGSLGVSDPSVSFAEVEGEEVPPLAADTACGVSTRYDERLGVRVTLVAAGPEPGLTCP